MPAEPSSDFFAPLGACGAVKRLFRAAGSLRSRQATFSRRWEPAEPSSDFFASLGASEPVMRHFEEPACQRRRHATF